MKKKFIVFNLLTTFVSLLLTCIFAFVIISANATQSAKRSVVNYTEIYANNYSTDYETYLKQVDYALRVTIIGKDGTVLADSTEVDVATLDNHLNRPEIVNALNNAPAVVIRNSDTSGAKLMYYALKVDVAAGDYVFVRAAVSISSVNAYVYQSLPYLIIIIGVSLTLSVAFALYTNRKLLKPVKDIKQSLLAISEGTYTPVLAASSDHQLNEITNEINDLSEQLQTSIVKLQTSERNLNYVLNNITDGIVVFSQQLNVTLINENAKKIFKVNDIVIDKGIDFLTDDKELITELKKNKDSIFELKMDNCHYFCQISKTSEDILIFVITDVSVAKENEKVRSEFFANASHELKTPLTSIIGFSELLEMKNTDPLLNKYITNIVSELRRMQNLIEDMLKLSRLENRGEVEKVDLAVESVVHEAFASLQIIAERKKVNLAVMGSGHLLINREDLYELIKNLVENGIRYNSDGGRVEVQIEETPATVAIIVKDNGIGIDKKDQTRIFERFYRVDKSRARESGGTGLGLSIVKHICDKNDAQLKIDSQLNKGTTISIQFYK